MRFTPWLRRFAIGTAAVAAPLGLGLRFALVYRARAGFPKRNPPAHTPDTFGLAFVDVEVPTSDGLVLPGWWIPAGPAAGPGVVLVHGWESARDRLLPHAQVLHTTGFHVLLVDVRGHGANAPVSYPLSAAEFAADARASVAVLRKRPDVTTVGLLGHSMGGAGALIAAAGGGVDAVVALAPPVDANRLTRLTFQLADLPIPALIAWPLAWLTTRVYLRPRGHRPADASAATAVQRISAPVLLVQGTDDRIVPRSHFRRLAAIRRSTRPEAVTETLLVEGGHHSWLYELPEFRAGVARFLTTALGGPMSPDAAALAAVAVAARRPPEDERLAALDAEPGGMRSLAGLITSTPAAGSPPQTPPATPPATPNPEVT